MREVEELIMLKRELAQQAFLKAMGREASTEELEGRVKMLEERLKAMGLPFTYLHHERIKSLEEEIGKHSPEEVAKAISAKQGELWEKVREKAELVKRNIELRKELGRLYSLLRGLPEREKVLKALAEGKVEEPFPAPKEVATLLARLGVKAVWEEGVVKPGEPAKEERRAYRGAVYWLPEEKVKEFDELARELDRVTLELQRLNAIKQARPLSEGEEKAFAEAQRRLVELLGRLEGFSSFKM